jgi:hypothetical protein
MAVETATEHGKDIDDGRFGRSVILWAAAGLPVAFVVITLMVWLLLDVGLDEAMAISLWPAILTGGFVGGFVGVVRSAE